VQANRFLRWRQLRALRQQAGEELQGAPALCSVLLYKFRRTWATLHLLNGIPMPLLQNCIGHSDMETLNRYLARVSAKSEMAKQLADNMAKMAQLQGTVAAAVMAETVKV